MAIYFTGLDRPAKATGYPVEEVSGWKTRGHGGMHSVKKIIIHHTAGVNNGADYNSYNTVLKGTSATPGPLAQFGIGRNTGKIIIFGAGVCYHAGKVGQTSHNNWNALGIEIENNGVGEKFGKNAYGSAVALTGELVKEFKLKVSDVLGHKEVAVPKGRKIDPNFSMSQFRKDVQAYIDGKGSTAPVGNVEKPKPTPAPKPKPKPSTGKVWPDEALKVTNEHTAESHNAWVKLLSDVGYKDSNLTTNFQRWLRDLGYYKGWIEAERGRKPVFGPVLTRALQSFLVDKKLLPNKAYIDGNRKKVTVRAEIAYLNSQREYYK